MACSTNEACSFKATNRQALTKLICEVRDLRHQTQCSSTRVKGNNTTDCEGEVTPEEMTTLVEELESAVRGLRDDVKEHVGLHNQRRQKRGRAQRPQADSGVLSWVPPVNDGPVQEEADKDSEAKSSTSDDDLVAVVKNAFENAGIGGDDSGA